VQKNFKLVILAIIILSIVPIIVEFWRGWRENKKNVK
jgi:membrane-associated protein